MAFHVVTNRCFLACEKVTSVVMEELTPDKPKPQRKRKKSKTFSKKKNKESVKQLEEIPSQFAITISYYPLPRANSSRSDENEFTLELRVLGKKEASSIFCEIVKEVQEQHPDETYLDKLVNKMLGEVEIAEPEVKMTNKQKFFVP